jgi:hypothetical protein
LINSRKDKFYQIILSGLFLQFLFAARPRLEVGPAISPTAGHVQYAGKEYRLPL